MVKIKIKDKLGRIQHREIKKQNKQLYDYNRKIKAYIKKPEIEIKKIKFIIRSKKQQKRLSKKVLKELGVRKEKIIKEKLEKTKEKPVKRDCQFNYTHFYKGINHDGYVRIKSVTYILDEDTQQTEIIELINDFKEFVQDSYYKLKCRQRFMYGKIHYRVHATNNMDDLRESSNTTHNSESIERVIREMEKIIVEILLPLLERYIEINIYKFEFVNYDFKSVMENE